MRVSPIVSPTAEDWPGDGAHHVPEAARKSRRKRLRAGSPVLWLPGHRGVAAGEQEGPEAGGSEEGALPQAPMTLTAHCERKCPSILPCLLRRG